MSVATSIGIYCSKERIDITFLQNETEGVKVKGFTSLAMTGEGCSGDIVDKVRDFLKEQALDTREVFLGIARKDMILLTLDLPAPTEENLRNVLGFELNRYTPYSTEEAYYDFSIIQRNEEEKSIRVLLLVAEKKILDAHVEFLKDVNLTPKNVEISTTAMLRGLVAGSYDTMSGRQAILNMGIETDEVILVEDGAVHYSRTFTFQNSSRGESFSSELRRGLKARGWNREELKNIILCGEAGEGCDLSIEEIEGSVGTTILSAAALPDGAGGERLPASARVSFGLALRGFDKEQLPVNLLSSIKPPHKRKIQPTTVIALSAAIFVFAIAYLFIPLLQARSELKRIDDEFVVLQPSKREVEKLQAEIQDVERRAEQLAPLRGGGVRGLLLLKEVTEILPQETWLSEFRYRGGKLEIAGYSSSASALIVLLENSPLFTEVSFSAPVTVVDKKRALITTRGHQRTPFVRGREAGATSVERESLERFKIKALIVVKS